MTEQRWDEEKTPACCEGLPRIALLGDKGEEKEEEGKKKAAQELLQGGNTPRASPGRAAPPATHPPEPLVSINTTACSPTKRQSPAVADLGLLLIKGSSGRAARMLALSPCSAPPSSQPLRAFPCRSGREPQAGPIPKFSVLKVIFLAKSCSSRHQSRSTDPGASPAHTTGH